MPASPLDRIVLRAFAMSDEVWARHANPWSVWTRVPVLPLLVLAIWSRDWIGWWCLLPVAAVALWTWLNPRVFPKPASIDSWASRAVLGERVWVERHSAPLPAHHLRAARWLTAVALAGMVPLAWGLITLEVWPTVLGLVLVYGGKLWFLDRMVWLYADMKDNDPRYKSWLY